MVLKCFDTSGNVANSMRRLCLDGEGPDYLGTRNQKINVVTVEDVKRVAGEVLKPDRLIVTICRQAENGAPKRRTLRGRRISTFAPPNSAYVIVEACCHRLAGVRGDVRRGLW
jgi:hypothetical protein